MPAPFDPTTNRRWPVGQLYHDLPTSGNQPIEPWVAYKHASAEWYLGALEDVMAETKGLGRHIGLEMAIDGFVTALSAAFDASVYHLVRALEAYTGVAAAPAARCDWNRAKDLAKRQPHPTPGSPGSIGPGVQLGSVSAVGDALVRENKQQRKPQGWLRTVRLIRNTMVHQDTVTRHYVRNVVEDLRTGASGGSAQDFLGVPGTPDLELIPFFTGALTKSKALCSLIITDAASL